jgi:hypothetical protein
MAVMDETMVIPEHLQKAYDKLRPHFAEAEAPQ